jgi:hypothetical protein
MLKRPALKAAILLLLALLLPVVLASCQLLGGTTVTFINATAFAISSIELGPLTVGGPLGPGLQTGTYSITPGQNTLTAQGPGGSQTNAVLFSIVAGHGYTITFNAAATFSLVTVTLAAVN